MSRVVVVGASSGLGAALTLHHAARGDRVVAVARRRERLSELAQASPFSRIDAMEYDISRQGAGSRLGAALASSGPFARIYAVAGSRPPALPFETPSTLSDYFQFGFIVWVELYYELCRSGSIGPDSTFVLVSSLAAAVPFPELELYSASKAAMEAWGRAERERGKCRISVVRPGQFHSEFWGPRPFLLEALPMTRARSMVSAVDAGAEEVVLGGWRDGACSRFASLLGPRRSRRWFLGS